MKVLHLGKYYPPIAGGIENFMGALLPALKRKGIEVIVLAHQFSFGLQSGREVQNGVPVIRAFTLGRPVFVPISPSIPLELWRLSKNVSFDLIHVHAPNVSAFWIPLLFRHNRIPLIVHWHSDVPLSTINKSLAFFYRFYAPLQKWLLERASAVIVTSPSYLSSSDALQPHLHKCHVIPLGLDELGNHHIEQKGDSLWPGPESFKVLCVGRLSYYKGHEFLINASLHLDDTQIVIVGEGEESKRLHNLVLSLNLKKKVHLLGRATSNQLHQLLSTCDCLCLPSIERTEAFGLVLLEAMRLGKTVVATDVPGSGMSWVVQDGLTGFVVKAADVISLVSALTRLRTDPGLCESMGSAGQARFRERFTMERVAEEIFLLYHGLSKHGTEVSDSME